MSNWRTELTSFICFNVLFSFFPIVALYGMRMADGCSPTISELATDGGVLTIAITLAAEALSQVVASGQRWRDVKLIVAGSSAWVIVCGSLAYAYRYAHDRPANWVFFVRTCSVLIIVSLMNATVSRFFPKGD